MSSDKFVESGSFFEITRKIEIDAAHRVPHHGSKCFAVHGHRYVIEATCQGELLSDGEQQGMVMDFGFLKECMMKAIHDPCDHGIILWSRDEILNELAIGKGWWKTRIINKVPTAENLAKIWFEDLEQAIITWWNTYDPESEHVMPELMKVRVYETPNCWADWEI